MNISSLAPIACTCHLLGPCAEPPVTDRLNLIHGNNSSLAPLIKSQLTELLRPMQRTQLVAVGVSHIGQEQRSARAFP